ncbi:glycosyltransferase family 2 protein [Agromyces sp. NPDC058484]|uniref:glycosyltransferase family 2 protein n=1 Tax=Agromyces sp. NPDC058484 TaxID=3346524 RepID=UPI00365655BC
MSTISVVVPSYNDAVYLAGCLDALAVQSRPADEIIVVDNGSTDDTANVAIAHGARLVSEPVRGVWPATAAGLDAASGDVLARLDADSVPAPGWLAEVERRMSREDRPTIITGSGVFYGANAPIRWIARNIYLGGYFALIGLLLGHPPAFGSNYAMRRDAWLELRELVHRDRGDVHDDLDLSWWIQPGMIVVRHDTLLVGLSARPFDSLGGLWRRMRIAFVTLAIDFRAWSPRERRAAHRRASAHWGASDEVDVDVDVEGEEPLPA